jgi:hypothetical protein
MPGDGRISSRDPAPASPAPRSITGAYVHAGRCSSSLDEAFGMGVKNSDHLHRAVIGAVLDPRLKALDPSIASTFTAPNP